MSETITTYPLCWPEGQKRTDRPRGSDFNQSRVWEDAIKELRHSVRMSGGKNLIVSSNLELRQDGLPYVKQKPDDCGVAIYFERNGAPSCITCDRYTSVVCNLWAIRLTIEAIRGIERWGSSDMMNRAFMGFAQLPPPTAQGRHWRLVLGIHDDCTNLDMVVGKYRWLARTAHPDYGGSADRMAELNAAIEQARAELGGSD